MVVVIAVRELVLIAPVRDDDGFGHEAIVEPRDGRRADDARNRECDDRCVAVPGDRRFADLRGTLFEQPTGIAEHFQRIDTGACQGCLGRALRAGPQTNQALIDLLALRLGRAFARDETGAWPVFIPSVFAADDFDVRIRPTIGQRAIDLSAAAGELVRVADAVSRGAELALAGGLVGLDRTGLTVDLDRAFTAILERDGELVLFDATQHAHVPRPVHEHRLQIARPFRRRVWRLRRACPELRKRHDRQDGREPDCERGAR